MKKRALKKENRKSIIILDEGVNNSLIPETQCCWVGWFIPFKP